MVIARDALSRRGRRRAGRGRLRAAAGGVGLPRGAGAGRAARPSRPQAATSCTSSGSPTATSRPRSRARRIARRVNLKQHRGGAHSIEGRGALAVYDVNEDRLTLWSSTQLAHEVRAFLMTLLGLDENQVRVVAPDVGGGFGAKFVMYPEEVVVAAACLHAAAAGQMDRGPARAFPRRRSRSATSIGISRSRSSDDGRLLGVRGRMIHDEGAYTPQGINLPLQRLDRRCPGPTSCRPTSSTCRWSRPTRSRPCRCAAPAIRRARSRWSACSTPSPMRSTLDRAEVRRRNLVPADKMPYVDAAEDARGLGDHARQRRLPGLPAARARRHRLRRLRRAAGAGARAKAAISASASATA